MDGDEIVSTYKTNIKQLIDSKRLREEKPEVAEDYTKESESRTLRLKRAH